MAIRKSLAFLAIVKIAACALYYNEPNTYPPSCIEYESNAWKEPCCFSNQLATYGSPYGTFDGFCAQNGMEGRSMCPDASIYMGIVDSWDNNMTIQYTGDPKCIGELYTFVYRCCPCMNANAVSTAKWPNADLDAKCVGCSAATETLTGSNATGFSCATSCTGTGGKRRACPVSPSPNPTKSPVPDGECKTSPAGVEMMKARESFVPNFYNAGEGDVTIGKNGHDCTKNKDCSSLHPPITQAQALTQFQKDQGYFEKCVGKLPNAALLNTNQFSALVSFTFNSGCGGLNESFKKYMAKKDFNGIGVALPSTHLGTKNMRAGVKNRRLQEQTLFLKATMVMSGC